MAKNKRVPILELEKLIHFNFITLIRFYRINKSLEKVIQIDPSHIKIIHFSKIRIKNIRNEKEKTNKYRLL